TPGSCRYPGPGTWPCWSGPISSTRRCWSSSTGSDRWRPVRTRPVISLSAREQQGDWMELATVADTRAFGERLAGILRAGDLVVLTGPLGAGKTVIAQGVGTGLGV